MTQKIPKNEDQLQAQIVTWFNNSYCLKHQSPRSIIFSIPNGGTRHPLEMLKMKTTGLLPGASDLIIIHSGFLAFIELKTEKGVLSPQQREFALRVTENGFMYKICRSLSEFQEFVVSLEHG